MVLGKTGRNFAAGMSGGIAFVYDPKGEFTQNCNKEMVDLETVAEEDDIKTLRRLIENHAQYTDSTPAKNILKDFNGALPHFLKVMPKDYKRVMSEAKKKMKEQGLSLEAALYG